MLKHLAAASVLIVTASSANAGQVSLKGTHLCCGACVQAVGKSLKGVKGVTDVACDRNSKQVTFKAADDKAAKAGIAALAKAGFYGAATHGDKPLAFPANGVKKGAKSNKVTFSGVHLCCGACVQGAQKAVQDVAGVTTIDVDRGKKTVTLTGKQIDVSAAAKALNAGGFYGKVGK